MYERSIVAVLRTRMKEPLGLMQVLVGPRQTGKSTALKQASTGLDIPLHSVSADFADADWLRVEWQQARNIVAAQGEAILIVDEVQKIEGWSNVVKELWDEDRRNDVNLKVFLSGSSSLLLSKGLDEALTGRFEMLYCLQVEVCRMPRRVRLHARRVRLLRRLPACSLICKGRRPVASLHEGIHHRADHLAGRARACPYQEAGAYCAPCSRSACSIRRRSFRIRRCWTLR